MSFRKYLTAKELQDALEEAVDEIERDDPIDVVFIPPDIDSLTDEEAIDNEAPLTEWDLRGVDIHSPENDSTDEETLAMKRMKLGKSREIHVSNEQNHSSDEETLAPN
ncbi:hypothetical protein JTB14_032262 [Gonioctena quinquepunctata]|nr:hypothetical protein JTB14_032262 [Gonioctena quinquepunctata]